VPTEQKDWWDKCDIVLKAVSGFLTALAVAGLGFFGSGYLKQRETVDTNARLYSELMSKREEAESALRKDMLKSIIETFLQSGADDFETKVTEIELLAYNFHESFDLRPLFRHLRKRIGDSGPAVKDEYTARLANVAREVARKQLSVLEVVGSKFDRTIELDRVPKGPQDPALELTESSFTLNDVTRTVKTSVLAADPHEGEIKVALWIRTWSPTWCQDNVETTLQASFAVGYFDFPMVDNLRLPCDQRAAVVLNDVNDSTAEVTVVFFPGAYGALKEKPYYDEILQHLRDLTSPIR
jgi:hypothetical protein